MCFFALFLNVREPKLMPTQIPSELDNLNEILTPDPENNTLETCH